MDFGKTSVLVANTHRNTSAHILVLTNSSLLSLDCEECASLCMTDFVSLFYFTVAYSSMPIHRKTAVPKTTPVNNAHIQTHKNEFMFRVMLQ